MLDVVSAAWRLDCALLQHRRQTAGHVTDLTTSQSTTGDGIRLLTTAQAHLLPITSSTLYFMQLCLFGRYSVVKQQKENTWKQLKRTKLSSYLSFPVLLLGFLRKDWLGPERVDMERGEALENVDGGVLGIFFPRWPIHFFCSSWVRASRSMSRAEVTS